MEATCVMCEEPITNPVCPACLQEGVHQWLLEKQQESLAEEVEELTVGLFANTGSTFCIKCDNLMALCTYCYTKAVFEIVKQRPRLVAEYLDFFNYDLEHLGWEQEAEKYLEEL